MLQRTCMLAFLFMQSMMRAQLQRIADIKGISKNVF